LGLATLADGAIAAVTTGAGGGKRLSSEREAAILAAFLC
jgi:hypothetical protein